MPAPRHKRTVGSVLNKLIQRVNADTRRLRLLEQENIISKTRINVAERNFLAEKKYIQKSLKEMDEKISKIEDNIIRIEHTIKEIVTEIKKLASTTKVKELQSLIEIYNPIKSQFMTKEEVERMIEEKLEEG